MKINNKGFFFTIGIIVLIVIPLLFLITFYTETSKVKTEDTIGKIRCDEVHYFVEDVKKDLSRAMVIFGRRAAIFSIDYLRANGILENYTFKCNSLCGVDCNKFSYNNNGSQAAIAELILCGTINGTNATYMINHTMREWRNRIQTNVSDINMLVNITTTNIDIVQRSPWEFATILNIKLRVSDAKGMCFYGETPIEVVSNTSIVGLEDPSYTLNSKERIVRYIDGCDNQINIGNLIRNGSNGNGNATGIAVFRSTIGYESNFCSTTPNINDIILVIDDEFNECDNFELGCYNATSPYHLAGVINTKYPGPVPSSQFENKCKISIPWMKGTGNLAAAGLFTGNCTWMEDNGYKVLRGAFSNSINRTCFVASNVTKYGGGIDGPSFFDRLDGRYSLSDKYANQSRERFNYTSIGIETFVNEYDLAFHLLPVNLNATWVDYLYWKNVSGCRVNGVCKSNNYEFRLDPSHADMYGFSIGC